MINVTFAKEVIREKKIANLIGAIAKGEHMVFPHLRETFHSVGVQHDNIKPSGTAFLEKFEKLSINVIEGVVMKGEDIKAMVRPMSSGAVPRNWTATNIPTIFHLSQ